MSVVKNTILVRYAGGLIDVSVAIPGERNRVEEYLELANVTEEEVAVGIARQRLSLLRADLRNTSFSGEVRDATQALGLGFELGDRFDGDMISSIRLDSNVDGVITATPSIADPIVLAEEGLDRRIARIAKGIPSEYANPITEPQEKGTGSDSNPPAFSYSGPLKETISPQWTAPRPYWISWLEVTLGTAATTAVRVTAIYPVAQGNYVLGYVDIPPGALRAVGVVNQGLQTGQGVVLWIQYPGSNGEDLEATLRGTMV